MSYEAMKAAMRTKEVSGSAKMVLLALAYSQADDSTDCWPSRGEMMELAAITENTLDAALKVLRDVGLVSSFPRFDAQRTRLHNGWVLHLSDPPEVGWDTPADRGEGVAPKPQNRPPQNTMTTRNGANDEKQGVGRDHSPQIMGRSRDSLPASDGVLGGQAKEATRPNARQSKRPDPACVEAARIIWEAAHASARSKAQGEARKVGWALRDFPPEPGQLPLLVAGIEAYYADPTKSGDNARFAAGPHRLIENPELRAEMLERGRAATGAPAQPLPTQLDEAGAWTGDPQWEPTQYGGPPGHHPIGTNEDPGPRRMDSWLFHWYAKQPYERDVYWPADQGPMPGQPGCRIWGGFLDHYRNANRGRIVLREDE